MALERHIIIFEENVEMTAGLDVGAMWSRMRDEFLGEWVRLNRQQLPAGEIERELRGFMDGLSDKHEKDLARTSSSVSYNQGRAAEIESAAEAGRGEFVVRSEVLDANTCSSCATLDGAVVEVGTRDFYHLMPPALCEGGDRCRGFYVMIGNNLEATP